MESHGERRQAERRSGKDRRTSDRSDPLPRRARLRRQADVLAYLQAQRDESLSELSWLDATPVRFPAPAAYLPPLSASPVLKEDANKADT